MKFPAFPIISISKRGLHIGPPRESKKVSQTTGQRYDAASQNRHTENHFKYADGLDANSKIKPSAQTLRNRVRYELRNNPYAKGISETLAVEVIGSGPRIQVKTDDENFNKAFEEGFSDWCGDSDSIEPAQCDLTGKECYSEILRLVGSIQQDDAGEGFIIMQTDPRMFGTGKVSLKLLVVEADRIATPFGMFDGILANGNELIQGIELDKWGCPVNYYVLKRHPGSNTLGMTGFNEYDVVPAEQVIHLARRDRAGQIRGVPRYTPSLTVFAQLRDYTNSTLSAAKTAANISATIEVDVTELDEADDVDAMDVVDIERDAMLTLPKGHKAHQFKPEQPTATYKEFKHEVLNEASRPMCLPYNIAAANSSEYNYASGRLDHQSFYKVKKILRRWIDLNINNRVARAWLQEARLLRGYKYIYGCTDLKVKVLWFWPGEEHVDPVKEAKAQDIKLINGSTTLADEYGKAGKDWEIQLEQSAKEEARKIDLREKYNLSDDALSHGKKGGENSSSNSDRIDELLEAVQDLIETKS